MGLGAAYGAMPLKNGFDIEEVRERPWLRTKQPLHPPTSSDTYEPQASATPFSSQMVR